MKAVELKTLAQFSSEKMQKNTVFENKSSMYELYCFEGGQSQRSQKLETDRYYTILEGKARVTVGRTTREFNAGTVIFIPAQAEHGIINITEQKLVVAVLTILEALKN